ncbi:Iterative polyketide synthase CazM 5 [Colletotrichum musicola]|uniref:Iterative polyketide synthase CazM 5 n=1 Tax=Colletotrichum musicola TaxID=2175873 RepID=A0A8H6U6S2_9PEZI|nr:Iterative polyketide synthase CazM 5 [Colletotrichum musicola]
MHPEPISLLVCGPLLWNADPTHLSRVRSRLAHTPQLQALRRAVTELPEIWPLLVATEPSLERLDAAPLLQGFAEWITSGNPSALLAAGHSSKNAQLAVLTVLSHLTEYAALLSSRCTTGEDDWNDAHAKTLQGLHETGIQGLCVGLLSAGVVACARSLTEVAELGAAAVRLALCAAAFVDLDQTECTDPAVCISARFSRAAAERLDGREPFKEALQDYPQAYMGVRMDFASATITATKSIAESLIRHLRGQGVTAKEINVRGRYHYPGHHDAFRTLDRMCAATPMLQFPRDRRPLVPLRGSSGGDVVTADEMPLHETMLRSILTDPADWHTTMATAVAALDEPAGTRTEPRLLVQLGPVDCVPRSVLGAGSVRVLQPTAAAEHGHEATGRGYPEDAVAVIGMSCQFPDAETPERFWDVIRGGRTATDSFPDAAAFDCGLFQKSPREAEYMDPQHRLGLHLAYEALESGGYFSPSSSSTTDVGCYVGMSSCDYEDHVNARPPTAFSYTGTARAFSSGRISHFFGLTGPSVVVDTVCSSSGVAIHSACRAILSGECAMALAGGVSLMTAEGQAHQNLAGASFLSSTGQCRPFDAGADGYRRGQGGGFVLLKRLSAAVADNDGILGVLAASAVNTCKGTRSITLPSSESQSSLYERVLRLADLRPGDVSYVEAHGTGTKKGDPIECQSIRAVFGRDHRCRSGSRSRPLRLGSVKANFGHAEAASGIASLVKVLLMLRHRLITPQVNFATLNPAIPPLEADDMEVAVEAASWEEPWRTALVNNYGASGTNAAVVVCQPPPQTTTSSTELSLSDITATPRRFPFLVAANTTATLRRNCRALLHFLETRPGGFCDEDLPSFAFHLARRQNHGLAHRAVFSAGSSAELTAHLGAQAEAGGGGDDEHHVGARHPKTAPAKPVVLLFSGQTGRRAHLNRDAYVASRLLQRHLDRCDRALQALGLGSLFPRIFDAEPVENLVQLHCMQFALQYSAAAAWIDSGLEVDALLGHSLGQLTALCVGGVLSLGDALRLVSGRASLVQTKWAGERGCMLSVDADVATVEAIASSSSSPDSKEDRVEIACYNASSHQVVAGTERAVAAFEGAAASRGVSTRRLAVTHAFHSEMVEDILPDYHRLLQGLVFRPATIPIEPCSELAGSWDSVTPELVARQSREPVYFAQAVFRVQERLGGSCVWLEAGSGSAAVTMARRALDGWSSSRGVQHSHSFHAAQLHGTEPLSHLADTTLGLWLKGVRVQFWLYHALQRCSFVPMDLPSYQFDKTRHWLASIPRHGSGLEVAGGGQQPQSPPTAPELVTLVGKGGVGASDVQAFEFAINQDSEEYSLFVKGRTVFGQILAPGSVFAESAARALALLLASHATSAGLSVPPSVELARMKLHAPFGLDPQRRLRMTLQSTQTTSSWDFVVESLPLQGSSARSAKLQASGTVRLQARDGSSLLVAGQTLLGRLHDRCDELRGDRDASVVQGAYVKKLMGRVAKYDDAYFAIRSIASRGLEAVGDVDVLPVMSRCRAGAALSPPAFDNFLLVAELHAGSLGDLADDHLYICGGFDAIVPHASPGEPSSRPARGPWTVLSTLGRRDDKTVACDILVFDAQTRMLFLSILGARLTQVPARSLQRVLEETNAAGPADDGKKEPTISDKTLHVGDWTAAAPPSFGSSAVTTPDAQAASLGIMNPLPVDLSSKRIHDELRSALSPPLGSATSPSQPSSDDRKDYSSGFSAATPASSATTPTSDRDQGNAALYMLLSEHLDLSNGIPPDMPLGNIGLDSLVAIQIQSDMEELFGKSPRLKSIDENSTYADLCAMVMQQHVSTRPEPKPSPVNSADAGPTSDGLRGPDYAPASGVSAVAPSPVLSQGAPTPFISLAVREFNRVKEHTAVYARQTGFADFYAGGVYQKQTALVLAYVLEAFSALGCDLKTLRAGDPMPSVSYQPKHWRLMERLHEILEEAGLVSPPDDGLLRRRTDAPLPEAVSAADLHREILAEWPLYQPDHRLLDVTASRLADCLSGRADPLKLLFQDRASLKLLEDVYISSPMFSTGNGMLGAMLGGLLSQPRFARGGGAEKLRILEIGAGTGATTRRVMDQLLARDVDFTYTFTDISPALVNGSKKKFGEIYGRRRVESDMEFATLDIERPPPAGMLRSYHLVVSSNCVHATRDLRLACDHIESLLRRDSGMLCLLELTRPLGWLDCVFGLLDGWWRFEDGRKHALAHEEDWKRNLRGAGFRNVDWTDDGSRESRHFRLITAWH